MIQTDYKHVALTPDGAPMIAGTRFKLVQLVVERFVHGWDPEELQFQHPQLTLAQIYSALAYYQDHRMEIDSLIRERDARSDALKAQLDSPDLRALVRSRAES